MCHVIGDSIGGRIGVNAKVMSQQAHENEPTRDLDPQDERSAPRQNPHQHLAPESDVHRRHAHARAAHQDRLTAARGREIFEIQ